MTILVTVLICCCCMKNFRNCLMLSICSIPNVSGMRNGQPLQLHELSREYFLPVAVNDAPVSAGAEALEADGLQQVLQ